MGALAASTFLSVIPAKAGWQSTDMLRNSFQSARDAVKSCANAGYNTVKGASHVLQGFNPFIGSEQRKKVVAEGLNEVLQATKDSMASVTSTTSSLCNFVGGSMLLAPETGGRFLYNYPVVAAALVGGVLVGAGATTLAMNPSYTQDALDYVKDLGNLVSKYDYAGYYSPVVDFMGQATEVVKGTLGEATQTASDLGTKAGALSANALGELQGTAREAISGVGALISHGVGQAYSAFEMVLPYINNYQALIWGKVSQIAFDQMVGNEVKKILPKDGFAATLVKRKPSSPMGSTTVSGN